MGKFLFGKGTVESLPLPRTPKFLLNMVYFRIEFIEKGIIWSIGKFKMAKYFGVPGGPPMYPMEVPQ